MIKNNLVVALSKKEINLVSGGGFFKEIGKGVQQANQIIDKGAREAGKAVRDAKDGFQAGRQAIREG